MIRLLLSLLLFCALALAPALAQTAAPSSDPLQTAERAMQKAQPALKSAAKELDNPKLSDAELRSLQDQIDPVGAAAQRVIEEATPRLAGVKARLAQLGPAPAANAPPEEQSLAAARNQQLALQKTLTAELAQAKLVALDAEQLSARLAARRRDLFVNNVFAQSYSVFSPSLWSQVAAEAPGDGRAVYGAAQDWIDGAVARLDGWTWIIFLGSLAATALLYAACSALARRILGRDSKDAEPSRLAKALAALWVTLLTALAPIVGVSAVVLSLRAFNLADPSADPFLRTLVFAVVRISLTFAIARGLLAPSRPNRRLIEVETPISERLLRLAVGVAVLISLGAVLSALADQVAVSLPMSVAIGAIAALAVAALMAVSLHGIAADPDDAAECLGPRVRAGADWKAPFRWAAWGLICALLVSISIGYVAFSTFLLRQLAWVALVGVVLYVALTLTNEGLTAAFQPNGRIARGFVRTLGIRRESLQQFAIIASGAATIALWIAAAVLVLAPWRIASSDMLGGLRAAFFGFQIGGVAFSLSALVAAVILFAIGLLATRWIQRWLDTRLLPATHLDVGLQNSIRTSVGYIGIIAAASVALAHLGVDFQKIAIVAGALSVGIGFGLQSIVNNFVSGLIILWERAIRVGDLVVIGDEQGHVKRINVRATEIETSDRVTMIVPNSNLVTGVVKNWVRGDRIGRIKISLALAGDADAEVARDILVACARDHQSIVKLPAPQALLTSIDGGALKFELVCFVEDVEIAARVKSDLHFDLLRRLRAAGMEPPPAPSSAPPITVHVGGLDLAPQSAKAPDRSSEHTMREESEN